MAKTIECQTAPLPHSPLPAAAPVNTAPAPRRPAATTTRRRLPPTVARLLLTTSGPTARRFASASPTRLALAVLTPCAREAWDAADLADLLAGVGRWPGRAAKRLAAHLTTLQATARTQWIGDMVAASQRLALGGNETSVERLASAWTLGAVAPYPGNGGMSARAVWLCLASMAWAAGTRQIRCGAGELEELTGVPTRTVWRALHRLEGMGLLVATTRSSGGVTPNRYRPVAPTAVPSGRAVGRHHRSAVNSSTRSSAVVCRLRPVDVEPQVRPDAPLGAAPIVSPEDPLLGGVGLHPGWHPRALGIGVHHLACRLAASSEALPGPALVASLGYTSARIAALVDDASVVGLADRSGKGVAAGPVLRDAGALKALLERTADESGTLATAEAHRAARLARAAERRAWRPGGAEGAGEARPGGAADGSNGVGGGTGPAGVWGDGGSLPRRGDEANGVSALTRPDRQEGGRER